MSSRQGIPGREESKAKEQESKGNVWRRMNFDKSVVSIGVGVVVDTKDIKGMFHAFKWLTVKLRR